MGGRRVRIETGLVVVAAVACAAAVAGAAPLEPPPAPPENPPNEAKRVLGKVLFFEEQLSADDSVACATCHVMSHGGTDPRRRRGVSKGSKFGEGGDVFASPGVVSMDAAGSYDASRLISSDRQITPRATPSPFAAEYAAAVLWDGRAGDQFVDPVSKAVVIKTGGALESQALLPLVNPAEMGHADRGLPEILAKLAAVSPLALADRLPADLQAALDGNPGYPDLFSRAFGDPKITAPRVAMAIATYERTLVPDRTDYDRFMAGDVNALTAQEKRGMVALHDAGCEACHVPPLFTDNTFRATGVRPQHDDDGRAAVTSAPEDLGRFKVPSLRNVALKRSFFHDGKRTTLHDTILFYKRAPGAAPAADVVTLDAAGPNSGGDATVNYGDTKQPDHVQFVVNQDPAMNDIHLTNQQIDDIATFLAGGLVDPRVQDEQFPFDRPMLASEHADLLPQVASTPDLGDAATPQIVVTTPALAGSQDFRVGVVGVVAGEPARLLTFTDAGGQPTTSDTVTGSNTSSTPGDATIFQPLTDAVPGTTLHFLWQVGGSDTAGGTAVSRTIDVPVIAPRAMILPHGGSRPAAVPASVDDSDAYVADAAFRVDWPAHRRGVNGDAFRAAVHVNPRGAGTDVSQAEVTAWIGALQVLKDVPLDADGRFHGSAADASYDVATGTLLVALRGLDLGTTLPETRAGSRGTADVPVVFTVKGLGIAQPSVAAEIPFSWSRSNAGVAAGRFDFRRAGSTRGAFQITSVTQIPGFTDIVGLRVSGVLAAPGGEPFSAPTGLTLRIGESFVRSIDPAAMTTSKSGVILAPLPGTSRPMRIDTRRGTFAFDVLVDDPTLTTLPQGSVVPLRFRIEARPQIGAPVRTYETVVDVPLH